jgi:parallel beta-helix repeat protein
MIIGQQLRHIGYVIGGMLLTASLVGARVSNAATYYVATTGNDSSSGTSSSPFRTINGALNRIGTGDGAGAGSTVLVKPGTYSEWINNNLPGGTSWTAPFTLKAESAGTVTIQPPSGADGVFFLARATSKYAIIDGFIMDGTYVTYDVVKISYTTSSGAAHHIRIQNSEVKNAQITKAVNTQPNGQGILVAGNGVDYNEFINLRVHDNGRSDFDHGLYISTANNVVEGCDVYRNAGWGVHIYHSGAFTAHNNIVRYNRLHDNARLGKRGVGLFISSGSGSVAYNNLIWNNNGGISLNYNASGVKLYNNTVYNNKGNFGIAIQAGSTGAVVQNNLMYKNGQDLTNVGSGTTLSSNLSGIDPKFVNAAAFDFRLQAGSPAIGQGADDQCCAR